MCCSRCLDALELPCLITSSSNRRIRYGVYGTHVLLLWLVSWSISVLFLVTTRKVLDRGTVLSNCCVYSYRCYSRYALNYLDQFMESIYRIYIEASGLVVVSSLLSIGTLQPQAPWILSFIDSMNSLSNLLVHK